MGKLDGTSVYLAGQMQFVEDNGVSYRQKIRNSLEKNIKNLRIFDPTNKPANLMQETLADRENLKNWKLNGEYDKVTEFVRSFRRVDLRMVDSCHFLIAHLDTSIFAFGTIDEILTAERAQKPIFVIMKQGKQYASDWLFAVVPHEQIFSSIEECMTYIESINNGTIPMDRKWVLI